MTRQVIDGKQAFQQQADAAISEDNPVSATSYTVLDTTKNVRIISISASVTWGVNQPILSVVVTIDGITTTFSFNAPVSLSNYFACPLVYGGEASQSLVLAAGTSADSSRAFLVEGRSIKVEANYVGGAGTTKLVCRVKYAKIP